MIGRTWDMLCVMAFISALMSSAMDSVATLSIQKYMRRK